MKKSAVHRALDKLVQLLEADGIPYAILGAMALNEHGYRRVTEGVDVLLTSEGLRAFKAAHLGRGYLEKFPGSRGLRDTENNTPIDVVIAGEFPGDGKPKAVSFPDPEHVAERGEAVRLLPLDRLIELKLASGMTAPHRLRDLADVIEVIRVPRSLPGRRRPTRPDGAGKILRALGSRTDAGSGVGPTPLGRDERSERIRIKDGPSVTGGRRIGTGFRTVTHPGRARRSPPRLSFPVVGQALRARRVGGRGLILISSVISGRGGMSGCVPPASTEHWSPGPGRRRGRLAPRASANPRHPLLWIRRLFAG